MSLIMTVDWLYGPGCLMAIEFSPHQAIGFSDSQRPLHSAWLSLVSSQFDSRKRWPNSMTGPECALRPAAASVSNFN